MERIIKPNISSGSNKLLAANLPVSPTGSQSIVAEPAGSNPSLSAVRTIATVLATLVPSQFLPGLLEKPTFKLTASELANQATLTEQTELAKQAELARHANQMLQKLLKVRKVRSTGSSNFSTERLQVAVRSLKGTRLVTKRIRVDRSI
jgi:hypothetical protein